MSGKTDVFENDFLELFYAGALSPAIAVVSGVIPRLTTASTITED